MKRVGMNVLLALGFIGLAGAIATARAAPASGYEVSIYGGTPTATWFGVALALTIATGVTICCRDHYQSLAVVLGGLTVTSVVAIPSIRNYRFSGMGDAMTHLGWTRDFVDGNLLPHELFYPGLHSISSVVHLLGGVSLERAVLLSVVFLFVPFVVFVPLVARSVTGSAAAMGFAAIVSWMVLPINNVATHMGAHTNSNALFIVPVVLFALVAFLKRRPGLERLPFGVSPFGVLVLCTGIGLLLVHPQQMINVVVLFAAISGVQFIARGRYEDHPMVEHPTTYVHTTVLGGLFVLWAASNERFRRAFSGLVYGLFTQDIGATAETDQRESSLAAIGGSLGELFVLMFLVSAILGLIVALYALVTWLDWTAADLETKAFVTYFALALFPLGGMFIAYFFGTPTMAFRQVGFIYVVLTILAGIALAGGFGWLRGVLTTPGSNTLAALFLGACLVLSLMTVFSSPIIYNAGQHVTDEQMSGFESGLEHRDGDRLYAGYGSGVERYGDAINGVEANANMSYSGGGEGPVQVDEFEAGNYSGAYHGTDYYFVVTEYDTTREHEVYNELHHSEDALAGLEHSENVSKVVSNDEYRMYAIDGSA